MLTINLLHFCKCQPDGPQDCGKLTDKKYLGYWCCDDCIAAWGAVWQKVGELGIPIRTADPEQEVPVTIAKEVKKGRIKKDDREFLLELRIEPL